MLYANASKVVVPALTLFLVACGGSSEPRTGTLGETCFPNGTCFEPLVCEGTTCVAPSGDGDTTGGDGDTTGGDTTGGDGDGDDGRMDVYAGPGPRSGLDMVFVIDNSVSMAALQLQLSSALQGFLTALGGGPGGLPDLHLAVISTDIGSGDALVGGCSTTEDRDGDNGEFQTNDCEQLGGNPFFVDVASDEPGGGRDRNYSGPLADALACVTSLGNTGCGFEQPYEALRRALDPAGPNAGQVAAFSRADAVLGVAILSDEDDCSAASSTLFSEPDATEDDVLGPLDSFRCFEFGVTCDQADRVRGLKSGCAPAEDSELVVPVARYVDFLRGLKQAPEDVVVAAVVGPREPVAVRDNPSSGIPQLAPSCVLDNQGDVDRGPVPGIRHAALVEAFVPRSAIGSACADDFGETLAAFSAALADSLDSRRCVDASVADVEVSGLGTQPDCTAFIVTEDGEGEVTRAEIARCENAEQQGCLAFDVDAERCSGASSYSFDLERLPVEDLPAAGYEINVRCTPK